jgi:hypothetical protein
VVPDSVKEICWGKLKEKFIFPEGSEALARCRALFLMGNSFRYFKFTFNKHVKNETKLDWEDLENQQPFWEEFVMYKMSEEAQASSTTNSQNSRKIITSILPALVGILEKYPSGRSRRSSWSRVVLHCR